MALSGRLTVSGAGTRVPVRVERPDGSLAAMTNAEADGSWRVDVPDGEYVVRPRWLAPFTASTAPAASSRALAPRSSAAVAHVAVANAAPADAAPVSWVVKHGDTAHSPIWAVLDADGSALDLTGWVVRAQARANALDPKVVKEWLVDSGVTVGTATVDIGDGTMVSTSTIQMHLDPADYVWLPETFTGVFDVEIELPAVTDGDPPQKRYTVVPEATFQIVADVTRALD